MASFDADARPGRGPRGPLRLLVALCLASVVILTIYMNEGQTGPVHLLRMAVQTVAEPFRWVGAQVQRPFDALSEAVENIGADSSTLSELRQENESLVQQLAQLEEYRAENERLESLLSLSSSYRLSGVAARVISASSDTWSDTVEIDKGTSAGVRVDMPVTVGTGVIGQVVSAGFSSSTVRLLSDPEMGVSAMLQGSRTTGVLTGSVDGSLHLRYVSSDVDVSVGELVVTSGLCGTYPKGLPLGRVSSTSVEASGAYRTIVVEPLSVASNLEEVYVVTSYDDSYDPTDSAVGEEAGADGPASSVADTASVDAGKVGDDVDTVTQQGAGEEVDQATDAGADQGQAEGTDAASAEGGGSEL